MTDAPLKTEAAPEMRVYPIRDADGKTQYVLAKTACDAVVVVYHPKIGRPLLGSQVADLYEQGIKITRAVYLPTKKKAPQNPNEPPGRPAEPPLTEPAQEVALHHGDHTARAQARRRATGKG